LKFKELFLGLRDYPQSIFSEELLHGLAEILGTENDREEIRPIRRFEGARCGARITRQVFETEELNVSGLLDHGTTLELPLVAYPGKGPSGLTSKFEAVVYETDIIV
jgi:hypothetical protein